MSPSRGLPIDIEALSGISGSISIACWVVVFSPQIIENFRRSSADGLSVTFIIIWLLGDVFNILGAVLQGVLPTMIILAVYYTLADIVLLGQCWYYEGFTLSDKSKASTPDDEETVAEPDEQSSLLPARPTSPKSQSQSPARRPRIGDLDQGKRNSVSSISSRLSSGVDATHLSPAMPFIPPSQSTTTPPAAETLKPHTALKAFILNLTILILVCGAGVLGWFLTTRSAEPTSKYPHSHHPVNDPDAEPISTESETLHFDLWGQIFGYLCAVLYLGSRVPQILLNYKRKSTEGVSMLFFIFACVGNLTYVMSIFAYEPACAGLQDLAGNVGGGGGCRDGEWGEMYARYILVNASWIAGSAGTLALDLTIFVQFWVYKDS